jgi:2-polyprenyl-3-methyl-5-hydroxy-6-metoxy-1,4-benzoquinol methylase
MRRQAPPIVGRPAQAKLGGAPRGRVTNKQAATGRLRLGGDRGVERRQEATRSLEGSEERCSHCGGALVRIHSAVPDLHFGAPGAWGYTFCAACQIASIDPLPAPGELADFYAGYYPRRFEPRPITGSRFRRLIKHAILSGTFGYPAKSKTQKWVGRLLGVCRPLAERAGAQILYVRGESRGKLVDVGCGVGVLLSNMRELGWEVIGVEADPKTARIAQQEFGLRVIPSSLEEAQLEEESVDVVTMSHLIEHVRRPESVLKEAWRVLKPGGRIVIVTPNVQSLGHRAFGECWQHLSPPYHLQLFSGASLQSMAKRAGFTPLAVRTSSRSAGQTWKVSVKAARRRNARPPHWYLPPVDALAAVAFHSTEAVAQAFNPNLGEELICEAVKA